MAVERPDQVAATAPVDQARILRDLTSLLALPAFWSGTEPAFVLRTLFEALESLLACDVCYGGVAVGAGERLQVLRVNRRPTPVADAAWAPLVALADAEPIREDTAVLDVDGSPLHCVRLPIGYVGEGGRLLVGSRQPAFPDASQLVTLRTAVSLAAAGLETARLIRERDEAQQAKDEFLAMLGHELRNPLAPIVTALQLMTMHAGGKRSREQEIIERQVQHLRTLVDDLLDVSRITRGRIDLHLQRVELQEIVARALETAAPLLEERHHDVEVQVAAGSVVSVDPTRMTQVVANLLTNAAKYTPPGGRIQISGAAVDGWVRLRVLDSGTGLPADLLPRVFDLFVQGRRGVARSEGGLGIGLALVKRLVLLHGGTVSAYSDGPGRGSEFVVNLPAAAPEVDQAPPAADRSDEMTGAATGDRVLVVDDNRDAADLAGSMLRAAGFEVEVAYSGLQALEQAARLEPDVVVLDIGLPDLDGYAVAIELQARRRGAALHLFALTGYGQAHDRARSAGAGFAAHLVKPVDPLELTRAVQRAADNRAPGRRDRQPRDGV